MSTKYFVMRRRRNYPFPLCLLLCGILRVYIYGMARLCKELYCSKMDPPEHPYPWPMKEGNLDVFIHSPNHGGLSM